MYVTMSPFHPMYEADWVKDMSGIKIYIIRMTHNKNVYYLKEYDIKTNEAKWTTKFMRGHHFTEEDKAKKFMKLYMSSRDSCDIYTHEGVWVDGQDMWVI